MGIAIQLVLLVIVIGFSSVATATLCTELDHESPYFEGNITTFNEFEMNKFQKPKLYVSCPDRDSLKDWLEKNEKDYDFLIVNGKHWASRMNSTKYAIIDVSQMRAASIVEKDDTVLLEIEAGTHFMDVIPILKEHGMMLAFGSCASVSLLGLLSTGGYTFLTRELGLAMDRLVRIEVVLFDGTVITADDFQNNDVFLNFKGFGLYNPVGVVTRAWLKPVKAPAKLTVVDMEWKVKSSAVTVEFVHAFLSSAPLVNKKCSPSLPYLMGIDSVVRFRALCVSGKEEAEEILKDLLEKAKTHPPGELVKGNK